MRAIATFAVEATAAIRASCADRTSFLIELVGMVLNDGFILLMWFMFFAGFRSIGGWRLADVALLIGIVTITVGTATVFAGGYRDMAAVILRGDVDVLLTQPKPVLARLLANDSIPSAWGDILVGIILLTAFAELTLGDLPFLVFALAASLTVYLATGVLFASLGFWAQDARSFARDLVEFVILFATYPGSIWSGATKLIVYTIFPAGFVVLVPVAFLREPSAGKALVMIAAALAYGGMASALFHLGLRRYRRGCTPF